MPALRFADLGYRARLPCSAGSRRRAGRRAGQARARLAVAEANPRRARRLDRATGRYPPRRLGVPICQCPLPRCRRHRRRRHGHGSPAGSDRKGLQRRHRARAGMDRRHAERERRLGRLRRRQRIRLPQQHSLRRPRRAARSADRGRHRALRVDAGAVRRDGREQRGGRRARSTICGERSLPRAAGMAAGA